MTLSLSTAVWFEKIHAYENSLVIGKIRQLYGGRKKKSHKDKSPKKASCIQIYKTYVQVMNLLSFGVRTMNKFSENKTLDFRNHVAY